MRETLFRDAANTTDTPRRRELVLQALPKLASKRAWDITIDIDASTREVAPTPSTTVEIHEVVITNLETVAESVTKMAFVVGGQASTLVIVPDSNPPEWNTWIVGGEGSNTGYRTGLVTLHLEETS